MAVTEIHRALGQWGLVLRDTVPRELWDGIDYFGHIAVSAGPVDCRVAGDSLLTNARYVGVVRGKDNTDTFALSGPGMAMWLGDEDGKGSVLETLVDLVDEDLPDAVRAIVPPGTSAILEGTYTTVPGLYTGTFQWVTQREALNYLTDTMNADWRVLGTGRLNVGPESTLFVTTPRVMVLRKNAGKDLDLVAFPGQLGTAQDVADFTTRVVLLADSEDGGIAVADADIAPGLNPYKDLHGTTVRMTRLVQETNTDGENADARAQLQLNRFSGTRDALTLSTSEYDVKGDVAVGDYLWVYDPLLGLYDFANQVQFRGSLLTPIKLRLTEMTWPITATMGVAYRDSDGVWTDLTPYLQPETGDTTLVVGGYNRSLSDGSNGGAGSGPTPVPDSTIPAAPEWIEPFDQAVYQSPVSGDTKAQTRLEWQQPLNESGSIVADGDYYEIRYRTSTTPLFPVTHAQLAVHTHAALTAGGGTFGQPLQFPVTDWQYQRVAFGEQTVVLYELTANMPYEAQVRLVDNATPANAGDWSDSALWQTGADTLPPSIPAAPVVAASLIAVQITHMLGSSGGVDFDLDRDLHHLEVHGSVTEDFVPTDATRLGRLMANWGMMESEVPAVGTFQVADLVPVYFKVVAVDTFGNKSTGSPAAVATAELIDNAHISSLTVSKVTAGTMTASWVMAGEFVTGSSGPRAGFNFQGFWAEDSTGTRTIEIKSSDGSGSFLGELRSGKTGNRIHMSPASAGSYLPEIRFFSGSSANYAYINAPALPGDTAAVGINSGPDPASAGTKQTTIFMFPNQIQMGYTTIGTGVSSGSAVVIGNNFITAEARNITGVNQGGFLSLGENLALWGMRTPGFGVGEYWINMNNHGVLGFKGFIQNAQPEGGHAAIWASYIDWNGGSVGFSFGATMSGAIAIAGSFDDFTATYLGSAVWNIYGFTSVGFSMGNNTGSRNGRWSAWAWRHEA